MGIIKKVNFNKSGSGSYTGRIILPAEFLKENNINKENPEVEVTYVDGKLIIEKVDK